MYNPSQVDHAIVLQRDRSTYMAIGYGSTDVVIGYAYGPDDADGDDFIDGYETTMGLNPASADSDCDGVSDGDEYPISILPQSDPLDGPCG